jgi:hypothetical protein
VGSAVLERKDGGKVTMARAENGWKVEGADGKKAKDTVITSFLDDVRDLRGSDVAAEPATDLGHFGLDAPDLRIALTDKDGQAIGTVAAAKRDGKYYVMRTGGEAVFEARDYMYARLDKQLRDFVEDPTATTTTIAAPPPPPAAGADEDDGDDGSGGEEGD